MRAHAWLLGIAPLVISCGDQLMPPDDPNTERFGEMCGVHGGMRVYESGGTDERVVYFKPDRVFFEPLYLTASIDGPASARDDVSVTISPHVMEPDELDQPITVTLTALDDAEPDHDQRFDIEYKIAFADGRAAAGAFVDGTAIDDDDGPGLSVIMTDHRQTSVGTEVTFSVVLDTEPRADVSVEVLVDTDYATPSPSSLTFQRVAWNVPQQVTLSPQNVGGSVGARYFVGLHSTSADLDYQDLGDQLELSSMDRPEAAACTQP